MKQLPRWTQFIQPAVAGLIIGIMGIWLPQVMGSGYPIVDQTLHDQFAWRMLLMLGLLKILATGVSFVSGTPGGMFAPTLSIGAMLARSVGGVEHLLLHQTGASVAAFALVGMGTFFAGFLRVPITSVFMVFEVSGHYSIVVPAMVANLIAYLISQRYQRVALFDFRARQDCHFLPSLEEQRERTLIRIEDAMRPGEGIVIRQKGSLAEALQVAEASSSANFLIHRDGGDWRIVAREALEQIAKSSPTGPEQIIPSRGPLPHVYPGSAFE